MQQKKNVLLAIFFAVLAIAGCDKNEKSSVNFDRKAMLENYGNTVIIPTYENLKSKTDGLNNIFNRYLLPGG